MIEDDLAFMRGAQWDPQQLAGRKTAGPAFDFPHLQALSEASQPWLFKMDTGSFCFIEGVWKALHSEDRKKYREDAIAHRDEAIRRTVVCRLEERTSEAAHWLSMQRFFEKLFNLEPINHERE